MNRVMCKDVVAVFVDFNSKDFQNCNLGEYFA